MADEIDPNVSDQTFPEADVANEITPPPAKTSLEVDPVSSEVDAAKKIETKKVEAAVEPRKKKMEKKDPLQTLKTAVIVSAVVVAVAGAVFAITKKLKEK